MFKKIFNKKSKEDIFFEKVIKSYKRNDKVDDHILEMFKNETRETINLRFSKAIEQLKKKINSTYKKPSRSWVLF